MMPITDEQVSAINDVIAICKDAENGFRGAADAVEDSSLKSLFQELSSQRGGFANELQSLVTREGGNPSHPSGVAGKLHSAWMSVKGTFTGHSAHEILEETERGEDLSLKTYREALHKGVPENVRLVLERQAAQVQQAHDRIRQLRDHSSH